MALTIENKRMKQKTNTQAGFNPTIGPSLDHTDGSWTMDNIYPGEFVVDLYSNKTYIGYNTDVYSLLSLDDRGNLVGNQNTANTGSTNSIIFGRNNISNNVYGIITGENNTNSGYRSSILSSYNSTIDSNSISSILQSTSSSIINSSTSTILGSGDYSNINSGFITTIIAGKNSKIENTFYSSSINSIDSTIKNAYYSSLLNNSNCDITQYTSSWASVSVLNTIIGSVGSSIRGSNIFAYNSIYSSYNSSISGNTYGTYYSKIINSVSSTIKNLGTFADYNLSIDNSNTSSISTNGNSENLSIINSKNVKISGSTNFTTILGVYKTGLTNFSENYSVYVPKLILSDTTNTGTSTAGTVIFNGSSFKGYNGSNWVDFSGFDYSGFNDSGLTYFNSSTNTLKTNSKVLVKDNKIKVDGILGNTSTPLTFVPTFPIIEFGQSGQENVVNFYGSMVIDDQGDGGFTYTSSGGTQLFFNNPSYDNLIQNNNRKFQILGGGEDDVKFTINDNSIISGKVTLESFVGSIQVMAGSSALLEVDPVFCRLSHSGDNYIDIDENEIEITMDSGIQRYIKITNNDIDIAHDNRISVYGYLYVDNISVSTYSNYQTYNNSNIQEGDFWYDGNNFRLKGGGIVLEDTVWDDLRVPLSMTTTGPSSSPNFTIFRDGVYSYAFDDTSNESLYFTCQMPHNWKTGTTIYPHIHWVKNHTNSGNVEWGLEYSWASINTGFTATATITASGSSQTQYTHNLTSLPIISGVGKGLSSMLVCRVFRNSVSGSDTMTGDAHLLEIDFHYEIDRLGSDNEYTNNN